jgi:hypothetical protein
MYPPEVEEPAVVPEQVPIPEPEMMVPAPEPLGGVPESGELLPKEVEDALRTIFTDCEAEDRDIRLDYLHTYRQLQLYARGIFDLFWDETARDWRSFSEEEGNDEYSRNINIFRGHMESVVAALSVKLPGTEFIPDDADDPLDIETAKGMGEVTKLIQKHNKSKLLLIKCLYLFWTQGTVFAYNSYREDPKFGTIDVPQKTVRTVMNFDVFCSYCGNLLGTVRETKPVDALRCEVCGLVKVPEVKEYPETLEQITGYSSEPKGRVAFDFWGPLNVKVPMYAKKQEDFGYLIFKFESHYAMIKNEFNDVEDKLRSGNPSVDAYDRYLRMMPEYRGELPSALDTISCIWIRPWMYWSIDDEEIRGWLFQNYPKGAYYMYADEELVAISDQSMDDCWTCSTDPLADFIMGEPLGKPLVPIQDMRNDLTSLSFQSIEYGIGENFVDPRVLDLQKYKESQALPGMFTAATARSGQTLGDGFYQTTPSRLSEEVNVFGAKLDEDGQFVTHDFPSVYGGEAGGSKTAFEYKKSNTAALQALGLTWVKVIDLWTNLMAKAAAQYVEHMKDDEKNVQKVNGKWINVWIRKQQLTGKIGGVEPETSETLPLSWEAKWQLILELIQMQDPVINSVLLSPQNSTFLKQAVAMPEIKIPGENDRNKQFGEIYDIINQDPSVGVDPDIDDHQIHMDIIKEYLTSMPGVALYKANPQVYQLIVQHYKEHEMGLVQTMQKQAMMQAGMGGGEAGGEGAPEQGGGE